METFYEVQQLLKRFGIFIYTRDREADKHMMLLEVKALYDNNLIDTNDYRQALLILKHQNK